MGRYHSPPPVGTYPYGFPAGTNPIDDLAVANPSQAQQSAVGAAQPPAVPTQVVVRSK